MIRVMVNPGCRRWQGLHNFGHKAKSPAMDGADHRLAIPVIPHRLAGQTDAAGDAGVRHSPSRPDSFGKLVLGHHAAAMPNKVHQQPKNLRLGPHRRVATAQFVPV